MKTRQEYMQGQCTHEEYYGQFVIESMKRALLAFQDKAYWKAALKEDKHLNIIRLSFWDAQANNFSRYMASRLLEKRGTISALQVECAS